MSMSKDECKEFVNKEIELLTIIAENLKALNLSYEKVAKDIKAIRIAILGNSGDS